MLYGNDLLEYVKENCPEHYDEMVAKEEKYESRKPYTPTPDEKELLKEILNMNDTWINYMEIYILNDGDICVRTPDVNWQNLCGREWWVNLKEKKSELVCMN